MKVTAESYGKTVTIEVEMEELNMDELTTIFKGIAVALEFHPNTVEEYLHND